MEILEIILIGIGLAMDAFAVSVSGGMLMKKIKIKNVLKIAFCFGFFQALMPTLGWLVAGRFENYIVQFDHWIALILLGFIGGKMIYESIADKDEEFDKDITNNLSLFILGIATSIDALMVGVTFVGTYSGFGIIEPVSIIGITTFLISFVGVFFGKKFGDLLGSKAELVGGIILVLIGIKIFVESFI